MIHHPIPPRPTCIFPTSFHFRSTFISNTTSTTITTIIQHKIQHNYTTHIRPHAHQLCNLPYFHIFYLFTYTTTQPNLHNINKRDETLPFSSNFFTPPYSPNDKTSDVSSEIIIPRRRGPLNQYRNHKKIIFGEGFQRVKFLRTWPNAMPLVALHLFFFFFSFQI